MVGLTGRSLDGGFWHTATTDEIRLLLGLEAARAFHRQHVHDSRIADYVASIKRLRLSKTKLLEAGILGHYYRASHDDLGGADVFRIPAGREIMEEMDAYLATVATTHRCDYEGASTVFRGTTVQEALDVMMTRTSGRGGQYPFKALSWDVGSAELYFDTTLLVYNGESIRGVAGATPVEYTYRYVHLKADERIETPMAIAYVPEREVRIPVLASGPRLEAVVVSEERISKSMLRLLETMTYVEGIRLVRL